jgi:hypothetical protein
MTIFLGMDDTDNLESRGTGRLARAVAKAIDEHYPVSSVTRHQLYVHADIPFTSHNSSAVLHIESDEPSVVPEVFDIAEEMMMDDFIEGSDPGLCAAHESAITPALQAYGWDAKVTVLTQERARTLAKNHGIALKGLGGTEDGVIGSLAGLGLASTGNDGRLLMRGTIRDHTGPQEASVLLAAGIDEIWSLDGQRVTAGTVFTQAGKSVKANMVGGRVVLMVEGSDGGWTALKRH